MELLDPLTDVETPNVSDDEDGYPEHPFFSVNHELPSEIPAPYRELYLCDRYKKNAQRKVLRMKAWARAAFARLVTYLYHVQRLMIQPVANKSNEACNFDRIWLANVHTS